MNSSPRAPFPWALLRFWTQRTLVMWCLIGGIIFAFQFLVCTIVRDNESIKAFMGMLNILPPFIKSLLGGETLKVGNISAFLLIGYQHPMTLTLFMIYAVGVPVSLLTGGVQTGTMELILARHVRKSHVYICAALLTIAGMMALTLVMYAGTCTAVWLMPLSDPVKYAALFKAVINGGLLAGAVGAIALLAGAYFRRRSSAITVTVAFLVTNYLIAFAADWWPRVAYIKPASLFNYVNTARILSENIWPLADMGILLAVLIPAAILGGVVWRRRDLLT